MSLGNLNDFIRLLSDETRLRILVLLAQSDLFVCELCGLLNLSQPKVSRHLAKMKDLGFVRMKREGKFILYSLALNEGAGKEMLDAIIRHMADDPILIQDKMNLFSHDDYVVGCNPRGSSKRIIDNS